MKHSLSEIETELKKRLTYPYKWGQKQNDNFDRQTNFIYHTFLIDDLLKEIEIRFKSEKDYDLYFNYSLNRWYNFWSAYAVENIFCSLPNVKPALDSKDRLVDFTIQGAAFDHKTSIFPKNFPYKIEDAIKKTDELIKWFYQHQSQQQRKHLKNRLFLVLYAKNGEHWKLKSEINWIKDRIEKYMLGFNPTLADVIWAIKD
jgi:hypothetical protein